MTPTPPENQNPQDEAWREGYDFEDFRESYRKFHNGKEAPNPFIVDLVAMQATVLAEVSGHTATALERARVEGQHTEVKHLLAVYSQVSSALDRAPGGTGSFTQRALEELISNLTERLKELTAELERLQHNSRTGGNNVS
jgi:hypothetical protein